MISFITVSREPEKVKKLNDSITLALYPHLFELIQVDGTKYDLFTGYNWGAEQARFDKFCFLHDDVTLLCNALAFEKPLTLLKKPFTGVIGVAGATTLPDSGCWWRSAHTDCRGMAGHPAGEEFGMHWNVWPWQGAQFGRTAITDGVFMMCSRPTFERLNGFDHRHFQGFHFYDIEFSFRALLAGLTNYVAPIPLFHNSPGNPSEGWEINRKIFLSLYSKHLPYRLT